MPLKTHNKTTYEIVLAKLFGGDNEVEVDSVFNSISTIDEAHRRIHAGQSFYAGYLWGEGSNIADNASAELLIQVGAESMHTIYEVAAGGDAEVRVFEAPTVSTAGTSVTAFNKARYSANASNATLTRDPSISADGTALPAKFLPGGTFLSTGSQDGGFNRETILNANTDYLFRVTNRAGSAQPMSISMEWYENI